MTASETSTEPEQPTPDASTPPDEETVKGWVREGIHEVMDELGLSGKPKDGSAEPIATAEPSEGRLSIKDVEESTRRIVEEAMQPLRDAKAAQPKPASKPKPKAEPEEEPTAPNRLRKALWG